MRLIHCESCYENLSLPQSLLSISLTIQRPMVRKTSERSGHVPFKTCGLRKTPNQSVLTKPRLAEEDKVVLELRIVSWGWMAISKKLHGRSWAACRSRFHNHLIQQYERDHSKRDKFDRSYQRCVVQASRAICSTH